MKTITKLIDGKLIKVRPQPHLADHSPYDMPFIDVPVNTFTRAKNTLTHVFSSVKCPNSVFIGDVTMHNGKWNWYSALIVNANPILQSSL